MCSSAHFRHGPAASLTIDKPHPDYNTENNTECVIMLSFFVTR